MNEDFFEEVTEDMIVETVETPKPPPIPEDDIEVEEDTFNFINQLIEEEL